VTGVSFVIPVHNGGAHLRQTLKSVLAQADGRPLEILLIDDGSVDGGVESIEDLIAGTPVSVLRSHGRGAAAAINLGIVRTRHPIVCQVDQDVTLEAGWLPSLMEAFDDSAVGAAQGQYVTDPGAPLLARVMGRDLELRYAAIETETDQVCTGNAAYRRTALEAVGLFDEGLGYGYDNDMSYRLRHAGYRLVLCRDARSIHHWRTSVSGYLRQQYGFGYGRLDLVAKHPARLGGDAVSPLSMMLHPVGLLLAMAGLGFGLPWGGSAAWIGLAIASALLSVLVAERTLAGVVAARRFHDWAALLFPIVHLMRDVAWLGAMLVWSVRRVARLGSEPRHSMAPASRDSRLRRDVMPGE
jgi:GT2 family glycosyltransferase